MCAAIDIVGDAHLNYLSVIIQTISGIENFMVRKKICLVFCVSLKTGSIISLSEILKVAW